MNINIVALAWQIIEMQRTILEQERKIERLARIEKDYNELLDSSLKHGNALLLMMGNMLKLYMTPGIVEACEVAAKENK